MSIELFPTSFNEFMDYYKFIKKYDTHFKVHNQLDLFDLLIYEKEDGDDAIRDINFDDFKDLINENIFDFNLESTIDRIIVLIPDEDKNKEPIVDILLDHVKLKFDKENYESYLFYYNHTKSQKFRDAIIEFMYKVRNDYLIKQLTSGADQSDISAISAIMEFMEYTQMESEDLWEYIIHNVEDPEFFMNPDTKVKYMQEMATDTTIGLRSLRLPDLVLENIINAAYDTRSGLSTYEIMDKIDGIMRPNPVQTRAARFSGYKDPIDRLGKTGVIGAGETLGVDYEL